MRHVLCHFVLVCAFALGAVAQEAQKDSVYLVSSTQASIQFQRTALNTIYLEIGGNIASSLLSINYEREFAHNFSFRAGLAIVGAGSIISSFTLLVNGFIGEYDHRFEYGIGLSLGGDRAFNVFPTGRLGYRYQPVNGGFNFGIAFTPFILEERFQPWGGISVGWGF